MLSDSFKGHIYLFDAQKGDNGLITTGFGQEILIALAHDFTLEDVWKILMERCKKISIPNIFYRTDAHSSDFPSSPIQRYKALQALKLL